MSTFPTKSINTMSKQNIQAYGQTPGSITSKKESMAGPGAIGNDHESRGTKKDKVTKKRTEFEKVSAQMLAQLDLTGDASTGKLAKNFDDAKNAWKKSEENSKP